MGVTSEHAYLLGQTDLCAVVLVCAIHGWLCFSSHTWHDPTVHHCLSIFFGN